MRKRVSTTYKPKFLDDADDIRGRIADLQAQLDKMEPRKRKPRENPYDLSVGKKGFKGII